MRIERPHFACVARAVGGAGQPARRYDGAMSRRRFRWFATNVIGAAFVLYFVIAAGGNWLGVGISVVVWLILSLDAIEHRLRRERCTRCGRENAMRLIGRRRIGFVRLRCRYCGAKRWGTIPEEEAGQTGVIPPD